MDRLGPPLCRDLPTIDTALLVELADSRQARSGRRLAEAIGRSRTGVQHVLNRLVAEGLVERTEAGNAHLYTFNHDHLLAPVVTEMGDARLELVRRLRELIGGWEVSPVHASMFGSVARGEGDADSDVDLLLVRPEAVAEDDEEWRGLVEHLTESIEGWTGNRAGIVELAEERLVGLRRSFPAVLRDVDRDAIDIAGTPVGKLLERGADGAKTRCDIGQARRRIAHARSYIDVAELAAGTGDVDLEYGPVAAGDAACCAAPGKRSRSDNHQDAAGSASPDRAGRKSSRTEHAPLISLKDSAQYGFLSLRPGELKQAMRHSAQLVEFAEQTLLRSG